MSAEFITEEKTDPRILRTRALLMQAFGESLSEKGFQALSVQDVTRKAGVNRTTFYLHFTDKYALLEYSIHQRFMQELEKRRLNLSAFSPENLHALIAVVADFIRYSNSQCGHVDTQFEALVEIQVKKQIQDLITAWLEKLEAGKEPPAAAIAASWAIYGLAQAWSHDKKPASPAVFAEKCLPLILNILGHHPGETSSSMAV
jgi:AcrR family transcriptional regulator